MSDELEDWARELLGLEIETEPIAKYPDFPDFINCGDCENCNTPVTCDCTMCKNQYSYCDNEDCDSIIMRESGYWLGSNSCCGRDDYYVCQKCFELKDWKADRITLYPTKDMTYQDWIDFKTWAKRVNENYWTPEGGDLI